MIGTGGMADVYIAEDLRLHRKVAVKILRSDLARDPAFVARFKKEALAAGGLNNPGIVAVFDSGEDGADSYIVMELVKGHTLRQLLQSGAVISQDDAVKIVTEILEALDYSHNQGIIHRDIKPGNIMITESGKVKVMDFIRIPTIVIKMQARCLKTYVAPSAVSKLQPRSEELSHVVDLRWLAG